MTSLDIWVQWIEILVTAYLSTEENSADCIQWANDLKAVSGELGILVFPRDDIFFLETKEVNKT